MEIIDLRCEFVFKKNKRFGDQHLNQGNRNVWINNFHKIFREVTAHTVMIKRRNCERTRDFFLVTILSVRFVRHVDTNSYN